MSRLHYLSRLSRHRVSRSSGLHRLGARRLSGLRSFFR
jgi:hypothetical protein